MRSREGALSFASSRARECVRGYVAREKTKPSKICRSLLQVTATEEAATSD